MKKIVTLCMALVLLLSGAMIRGAQAEDKIKIVATTFPSYDWTKISFLAWKISLSSCFCRIRALIFIIFSRQRKIL